MRKDGVSEHRRHFRYFDSGMYFPEKALKNTCSPFYLYVVKPHTGEVLWSAQLPATELVGF